MEPPINAQPLPNAGGRPRLKGSPGGLAARGRLGLKVGAVLVCKTPKAVPAESPRSAATNPETSSSYLRSKVPTGLPCRESYKLYTGCNGVWAIWVMQGIAAFYGLKSRNVDECCLLVGGQPTVAHLHPLKTALQRAFVGSLTAAPGIGFGHRI